MFSVTHIPRNTIRDVQCGSQELSSRLLLRLNHGMPFLPLLPSISPGRGGARRRAAPELALLCNPRTLCTSQSVSTQRGVTPPEGARWTESPSSHALPLPSQSAPQDAPPTFHLRGGGPPSTLSSSTVGSVLPGPRLPCARGANSSQAAQCSSRAARRVVVAPAGAWRRR